MAKAKVVGMGVFKYDNFPFIVIHKIYGFLDGGYVDIGDGYRMNGSPIIILSEKDGLELEKFLAGEIDKQYIKEKLALRRKYLLKISDKCESLKEYMNPFVEKKE